MTSPLVGREPQLDLLKRQVEQLKLGTGGLISVIGEAGLGKSTLIAEVKKSNTESDVHWLRGDAVSYARSVSYFPWRQIIRQSIDAHEDDSPGEVRNKLTYICDCCSLPGGDIPFLEAMLAVESEESLQVVTGFQGEALIQRMIDAVQGYLCGLTHDGPVAIVFDDLHWADEASLNLLLSLVDLTSTHPILFICLLRPDESAAGWDVIQEIEQKIAAWYYSVSLEPLHQDQTDVLLRNLLGETGVPKNLRDKIIERANGNPFFIEELIRSLIETDQIVRENSHWRTVHEDANFSLPNTLRGVLGARIDRLPELTKHVLQNAAVIGRSFDVRVLKRLTNLNGEFDPQIQYLRDASLVEHFHEEYTFRHVLIQEAAYDSILIKNRVVLHKRIAEILEEIHANRIEEFAPLIAYHFYSGQDDRSLNYDLLAGKKAARLYANTEAALHFGRALEVEKRGNVDADQIAYLFSQLGAVLELSGRYQQALANYDDMQSFGVDHQIRSMEMKALMAKATIYSIFSHLHDSARSEQMLIEALEISREIGDLLTEAKLHWNLMLTFLFSKRLDQALEHGETALTLARQAGDREQLAFVLNDLCRLYTCRGEFEKAHAAIREARELWTALDNQVMFADSLGSEAEAYFNNAQYEQSLNSNQQALKLCEQINNPWGQSYNLMLISFVYFENGQLGQGILAAEHSNQLADEAGLIASSISMRSELAWIYAYCGEFEKGFQLIELALEIAEVKQLAWRSFPIAAKVRMYLLQNDIASAEQTIGNSILQPTSIPYARYTIFVCLANIEFAIAKKEFNRAFLLSNELLDEVTPLTRVDVPEVLRWKARALIGLERVAEASQVLIDACSRTRDSGSRLQLWAILSDLSELDTRLGNRKEAEATRAEAQRIVEQIAESLREVGLRDSFLNEPRVQKLMR